MQGRATRLKMVSLATMSKANTTGVNNLSSHVLRLYSHSQLPRPEPNSNEGELHQRRPQHRHSPECELPPRLALQSQPDSALFRVLASRISPASAAKVSAVSIAAKTQISAVRAPELAPIPRQRRQTYMYLHVLALPGVTAVGNADQPIEQHYLAQMSQK